MTEKTYADFTPADRELIDVAARAAVSDPNASGTVLENGRELVLSAIKDGFFSIADGKVYVPRGSGDGCPWSRRIVDAIPPDKLVTLEPGEPLPGYEAKKDLIRCPVTGLTREAPKGSLKKNLLASLVIGAGVGVVSGGATMGVIAHGKYKDREKQRNAAIDAAPDAQAADVIRRDYDSQNPIKFGGGEIAIASGVGAFMGKETFYILGGLSAAKAGLGAWKRRRRKDEAVAQDGEPPSEDRGSSR